MSADDDCPVQLPTSWKPRGVTQPPTRSRYQFPSRRPRSRPRARRRTRTHPPTLPPCLSYTDPFAAAATSSRRCVKRKRGHLLSLFLSPPQGHIVSFCWVVTCAFPYPRRGDSGARTPRYFQPTSCRHNLGGWGIHGRGEGHYGELGRWTGRRGQRRRKHSL